MPDLVRTPHTSRGADALRAALDDLELEQRMDALPEPRRERFHGLPTGLESVTERLATAGATDVLTADEALEDLAVALGRESPFGDDDDLYDR